MQVAVEPQRRARPLGCGNGAFPDRSDGIRFGEQPQLDGRGELLGELLGMVGQWPPAASGGGRPVGGRLVKGRQEGGQGAGRLRGTCGGSAVGGPAGHPGGDDPGSRKPLGGLAEALRDGNGQGKARERAGSQACSLRSRASADCVAQGNRTARSSPSRHSWLSQPRAPSFRERPARSGCWSSSRSRTRSALMSISVWGMRRHGSRTLTRASVTPSAQSRSPSSLPETGCRTAVPKATAASSPCRSRSSRRAVRRTWRACERW